MNYNPKKYVLIQARTSSSRLFGKCILYIKNKELIHLLYDRIKSKNYKTTILTSNHPTDDYLSNILKKRKINFFRGDLDNVRKRFLDYTSSFHNNDIIIRCTADNLFIDKFIINDLIKKFEFSNKDYLNIDRKKSSLPYGLSVEIFKVGALRKIKSNNKIDLEHVTPSLKKNKKKIENVKINFNHNLYNQRCTIDTIYDYFKIKYIFENFNNKAKTKWYKLCNDLNKINKKSIEREIKKKFDKIILGTAQFGYQYGINNRNKKMDQKKVFKILTFAKDNYINYLDTAESYKKSEQRIGNYQKINKNFFNVITKFKIDKLDKIKTSFTKIKSKKIFSLLIHNPSQIEKGYEIKKLNNELLKFKKKTKYFGVSLNYPYEFHHFKKNKLFKIYQIPYNILDFRWDEILSKKENSYDIYARSIFLQGLLLTNKKNCPLNLRKEFDLVKKKLFFLKKRLNRFDEKDLLFNYVNNNNKINKIIIGIDNLNQVKQIPFYLLRKNFTLKEMKFIKRHVPKVSKNFISPINWHN